MMACGLPIIANRIGSITDYLPTDASILIEKKDSENIIQEIIELAANQTKKTKWDNAPGCIL